MNRRSPSIQDIALAAGVANSTVSRALRDSPLISVDVRQQIQQIAREMGYMPNGIAQSLQGKRTNTIGLVVTSIADPFFSDVARGVEEVAQSAGLSVFLSTSHFDPAREIAVIETFQRRRVDGIIVADSRISTGRSSQLVRAELPTVLINNQSEESAPSLHTVAIDDYVGARLATEHLIELGHRNIGYIGVANRPKSNRRRLEGFRDALADAGLAVPDSAVAIAETEELFHENDVDAGQTLLGPLIQPGVTGVVCYNDMVAIGALMACRALGIAVPDELSVVGFDDIAMAQYVTPPLTTVRQSKIELGRIATEMLLQLLENQPVQDHIISPTLVERASSAPLNE